MKRAIKIETTTPARGARAMRARTSFLVVFAVSYFALFPLAQAVVPPPDGGYPGFNTAEGQNALLNLTAGQGNTAVGWFSLWSNTDGSFNTGVGAGTLLFNVGDQIAGDGVNNTALGTAALLFNTTGSENTAVGTQALFSNTEGNAITATGYQALANNTTGFSNTANGYQALNRNSIGIFNTANGESALYNNTTGSNNTATGAAALFLNTEGADNTAYGSEALADNATGSANTANGYQALSNNTIGVGNTASGYAALFSNTTGSFNTANGYFALANNTTGNSNTALGDGAGDALTTGFGNVCIGLGVSGVADESNHTRIRNISGTNVAGGVNVVVEPGGNLLGILASSRRFKKEIKPMDQTSESILALKPVTFHYKNDQKRIPQFGLIAEDVAEVNPDLVARDKNGEIYTVRYDQINAMLLNEFLKEHKRVEAQQATITELKSIVAQQQKGMEVLTAQLKEQAAQIQRVSALIELDRPAAKQVVLKTP
jgi:hypothetical protein